MRVHLGDVRHSVEQSTSCLGTDHTQQLHQVDLRLARLWGGEDVHYLIIVSVSVCGWVSV